MAELPQEVINKIIAGTLNDVLDRMDEGVCDICEHSDADGRCYYECDDNGWEMEALKKWLKEKLKQVKEQKNEF